MFLLETCLGFVKKEKERKKDMKDKIFGVLQKMGRSFLLPIAVLPIAGIFLGAGSSILSSGYVAEGSLISKIMSVLTNCGDSIFGLLPLLLCVAVALGLAQKNKEVAAISAVIGYFAMNMATWSVVNNFYDVEKLREIPGLIQSFLGFTDSFNTSVLGSVILGLIIANIHNKYYNVKLPEMLSFFGGLNFIPIASFVAAIIYGIVITPIWPVIAQGIAALGQGIAGLGHVGTFLYGFIYRLLIPTGLHHVFYVPFWQTALGGTMEIGGEVIIGAQNILFEEIRNGMEISPSVARFYSGEFAMMMFGLPGAALAMYRTAYDQNKKKVKGLLASAAFTSFLTGITEPIEFSFLFVLPILYFGVHSVLAGLCFVAANIIGAAVGYSFSAGAMEFFLYGIMLGDARTHWMILLALGVAVFFIYYFVFKFLILKFNMKTPGREDHVEEVKLYTKKDVQNKDRFDAILQGLGGIGNIIDIDHCATRLRIRVTDETLIRKETLETTGAHGVIVKGTNVQIIYGPAVSNIRVDLEEYVKTVTEGGAV